MNNLEIFSYNSLPRRVYCGNMRDIFYVEAFFPTSVLVQNYFRFLGMPQ